MNKNLALFAYFFIIILFSPPLEGKVAKYQLSILAVFQNEAEYLTEWIEFHRLVGVDHFLLYSHRSTDHYEAVLTPYIEKGIVELYQAKEKVESVEEWNHYQCQLYLEGLDLLAKRSEWVAILDSDEFLFPVKENDLRQYLKKFKKSGALAVNWQLFGTSNVEKILPPELLIEKLIWKGEENYNENRHIKSIVRPKAVVSCKDPHFFRLKKGMKTVASNGKIVTCAKTDWVDVSEIRINHYWTRDETYFRERKMKRRQGWAEPNDAILQRKAALHGIEDTSIQRFVPELKQRLLLFTR